MKRIYMLIIVSTLICFLELIAAGVMWRNKKNELMKEYEKEKKIIQLEHEKKKKTLKDRYEENRYLASGESVYERIYNKQGQSIVELIERLSKEAYPPSWRCEAKVEEFTNFILLMQINLARERIRVSEIIKPLVSVINYSAPYLKNVAVFDNRRKCFMYFDEAALDELKRDGKLSEIIILDAKNKGRKFTRYNSIRIDYEEENGHIFIPAIIISSLLVIQKHFLTKR